MPTDVYEQQIKAYKEDSRYACQFGLKCYQKNPAHQSKYKHPPKKQVEPKPEEAVAPDAPVVTGRKRSSSDREDDATSSTDVPQSKVRKAEETASKEAAAAHSMSPSPSPKAAEDSDSEAEDDSSASKDSPKGSKKAADEKVSEAEVTEGPKEDKKMEVEEKKSDGPSTEANKIISDLFLVKMPEDFHKFYDFCSQVNSKDPCNALKPAGLKLVGPYDVLNGKIQTNQQDEPEKFLRHWRYFYDPPEFQTIVKESDKEGLHFGYWRDSDDDLPIFVAKNEAKKNCKIEKLAPNIFGAVESHLAERRKKATPFEIQPIDRLSKQLKAFAADKGIALGKDDSNMRDRERKVVAKTFHGAGIVVPYNKKTQLGYRDLAATDSQLRKILKKIEEADSDDDRKESLVSLDEIVRLATIAGDECDFGTCLELGHDLFSSGVDRVQKTGQQMLASAYKLLHREKFLKIAEAHAKDRKKGCDLSVL